MSERIMERKCPQATGYTARLALPSRAPAYCKGRRLLLGRVIT